MSNTSETKIEINQKKKEEKEKKEFLKQWH